MKEWWGHSTMILGEEKDERRAGGNNKGGKVR
jgi:hypothetical protein